MRGLRVILRALGQRNYGLYAAGNSVSLVGTWMQRIAIGWLAWELTHSGTWLGVIACADLAPSVLIGPIGGAVADRVSKLRIIVASQIGASVLAFALWGVTAAGWMTIWLLAAMVVLNGVVLGFNQPARLAIISSLVRREDVQTAVAINAIVFNAERFVGPAVAGLVIATYGTATAFLVNSLTYVVFLVSVAFLRLAPETRRAGGGGASILAEIGDSMQYVGRHPGIGPILLLQGVLSLGIRAVIELMPGFAATVFGRGVDGLAWLTSTIGVGAIVSGVWLASRGRSEGTASITLMASAVAALAILGFVAGAAFWPALACLAAAGAAMTLSGVGAQSLVQMAVAPAMRGRVLSLYGIIIRAGPAAGALLIGAASDAFGLRLPTALAATATFAACLWAWMRRRSIAAGLAEPESGCRN
jgi:predicted MFS family arabinose efflux permease